VQITRDPRTHAGGAAGVVTGMIDAKSVACSEPVSCPADFCQPSVLQGVIAN